MKKGFSLVELIVVIGIIAILAGVLFVNFSGGSESARLARCLSNMRNLATACQAFGAEHSRYPHAGSIEYMKIDESEGIAHAKTIYNEEPGWISWSSKGSYGNKPTSAQASGSWMTSMYNSNVEENQYCLTNGVLWRYVSGSHETYVCPSHAKKMRKTPPVWSYLMNAYFGWYSSGEPEAEHFSHIEYGRLDKADKVLLFSEIPFEGLAGSWLPDNTGPGTECDCVLQFSSSTDLKTGNKWESGSGGDGNENIGFNHKAGNFIFATVVFADAHVEKLRLPKNGMSDGELRDLTTWLCLGVDVSFDGQRYQKIDN